MLSEPLETRPIDYASLRAEAIRRLGPLADRRWTDFNDHDPGITILEQLCYALTDLIYRIGHDVPDLLASSGDPARALYWPGRILTSEPVAPADFRKLLLDVPGVKNGWIEPFDSEGSPAYYFSEELGQIFTRPTPLAREKVILRGLHRVVVLRDPERDLPAPRVRRDVAARLHRHRSLCEDFAEIRVLEATPVALHASIEIDPVDDPEQLLADIYRAVADFLAPSVAFRTLDELLKERTPVDKLFAGPLLDHGFLDDEALRLLDRRGVVYTSDLIRVIMGVDGVRAVPKIAVSLTKTGDEPKPWSLDLKGETPALDLYCDKPKTSVTLRRDGFNVPVDADRVAGLYNEGSRRSPAARPPAGPQDLPPPPGRDRRVGVYHSIQHHFPALYGVGPAGLPESASPERRALAKQLKAYLLFFDQILANDFAQLAHIGDLFSFDVEDAGVYFTQAINDPALGLDGLLGPETTGLVAADRERALERRNRLLNHLLARFAEQFSPYPSAPGASGDAEASMRSLIRDKQAFLQSYPRISGARGTGFDYRNPEGAAASGLEERVRLKLGIARDGPEQFVLIEYILLRPLADESAKGPPVLSAVRSRDPYSLQLAFVFPEQGRFATDGSSRQFAEQTAIEETPAHLIPYVFWLDPTSMATFRVYHRDWIQSLQGHANLLTWDEQAPDLDPTVVQLLPLGFSAALFDPTARREMIAAAQVRLRDARDRLIEFLGLGLTHPIRDLRVLVKVDEKGKVKQDEEAEISIFQSQRAVTYQVVNNAGQPVGESGKGGADPLILKTPKTPKASGDVTYRILARKDDTGWQAYLHRSAVVKVE
jgi:hypothetical protein